MNSYRKKLFKAFCTICLDLLTLGVSAQTQKVTVTGTVTDEGDEPLVGVSIHEKNTSNGTVSDIDGSFKLTVPQGSTIQFVYIGFETQEVVARGGEIRIKMTEDLQSLEETVVVAYGTQKKASLTSAISSVNSQELTSTNTNIVANSLAGKVAGITTRQIDGRPGASTNLEIRNMGTPLYVVDGVPVETSQFNNLDVNDIESISVLKDASASIYGLRAANGVVLVTTKMGKANQKNSISANFNYGFQDFVRIPEVANAAEFYEARMQAELNTLGYTNYSKAELLKWQEGKGDYESFDWQDWIVRKHSPQMYANVAMDGGSEGIKYHFSVSHTDQNAMLHGNNFKRTNIQSNTEAQLFDNFKVGMRISGRVEERHNIAAPPTQGYDDYWQPIYAMFQNWPTQRPYANDNPLYVNSTRNNATGAAIFSRETSGYTDDIWKTVNANAYAEWDIFKGLKARASYTYWVAQRDNEIFRYSYKVYTYDQDTDTYIDSWGNQTGDRRRDKTQNQEQTFQAQLNYNNNFGGHQVTGMLGMEALQRKEETTGYNTVPTNNYIALTNGIDNITSLTNSELHTRRVGYIFRATYDWQSRYLVEASGRYDGSYLYAAGQRWGFFPSVSAGWRISEEPFMKGIKSATRMSTLKFRVSWGEMGEESGVSAYGYLSGYNYGSGSAVLDGETVTGVVNKGVPVTNLSWVRANVTNIGFDYGFLDNKLSGAFEIFQRKRTGIPAARYDVLVPTEVGFSLPNENLNSDYNKGLEFSVNWQDRKGDFSYSVGGNLTVARAQNGTSYKARFGSTWDKYLNGTDNRWVGANYFWTRGYHVIGRFEDYEDIQTYPIDNDGQGNQTMLPGDFKFEDINGDGIINTLDKRQICYDLESNPIVMFGINTSFSYKGFDIVANFVGATASSYWQDWEMRYPFQGEGNSAKVLITDCWHRADPSDPNSEWISGMFPATRNAGNNVCFNQLSDFWMHSVTYLKLRTLEVGYTVPKRITSKFKCQNLRLYMNAYNLFSLDNLSDFGIDPEIKVTSALVSPNLRTISIGANFTF